MSKCSECVFADYFGDYAIWSCERLCCDIDNVDEEYDCEYFSDRQIELKEFRDAKEI